MSLKLTRMRTQLGIVPSFYLSKNHLCKEVLFSLGEQFHTEYWDKHLAGERPISLFSPALHSTWVVSGEEKN